MPEITLIPGLSPTSQGKLLASLLVVGVLIVARRLVLGVAERQIQDRTLLYKWSKGTSYTAFVVGLVLLAQVWFVAIRQVGTFLGLLSAGVAIALKDIVADLAGWIFIMWRRPFDIGDRVQIGPHAGDVVDIRIFQFTIMEIGNWVAADQSTGRLIHIPNAKVFTEPQANYTAGFPYLWNELPVVVTFESDWRKAKAALQEIAEGLGAEVAAEAELSLRETSKRFLVHYKKFAPAVYTSLAENGVLLTVRYLTRPRERRGSAQALWERIFDAFKEMPDVAFAYPTQRLYANPLEGKAEARALLPPSWV